MAGPDVPPADDRALEVVLRDERNGPPPPGDATPWDFVLRWPDAVVRERVWPIVSRLLIDADATVRARAVELVRDWSAGADVTVPRLLEVAENHAEKFRDQPVDGVALRESLAHALSNRVDADNGARIAAVLRTLATRAPVGGGAASVLGRYEPQFVTAQAQKWGDAQIDWIEEATRSLALFRRDAIVPLITVLRGLSRPNRERLLAAIESTITRDDATATTLALGQGLPPPEKAAPSVESLRDAIGF